MPSEFGDKISPVNRLLFYKKLNVLQLGDFLSSAALVF